MLDSKCKLAETGRVASSTSTSKPGSSQQQLCMSPETADTADSDEEDDDDSEDDDDLDVDVIQFHAPPPPRELLR